MGLLKSHRKNCCKYFINKRVGPPFCLLIKYLPIILPAKQILGLITKRVQRANSLINSNGGEKV